MLNLWALPSPNQVLHIQIHCKCWNLYKSRDGNHQILTKIIGKDPNYIQVHQNLKIQPKKTWKHKIWFHIKKQENQHWFFFVTNVWFEDHEDRKQ
jgi:hypothetical protein